MIKTSQLTRSFITENMETTAVKEVNLAVEQGEFVAIMGPSGCGKSTLLNLLGLIDRPSSGSYDFNGIQTETLSENSLTRLRRGSMGFIFQNYNLVEELNITENVELPLVFMGMGRKERKDKVSDILHQMKMGHRSRHYPGQLSGGQQQRVAFARAIVNQPLLLLADEPTGNLDPELTKDIMVLFKSIHMRGTTVLVATHSRELLENTAQRVLVLDRGKLVDER